MPGITKQTRYDVKWKVVGMIHMITVSFCRRDFSIYSLWYLKESWNQSLLDNCPLTLITQIEGDTQEFRVVRQGMETFMMAEFLRYFNQSSAIEGIAYPDMILYPSFLSSFLHWVFLNICAFFHFMRYIVWKIDLKTTTSS